MKIIVTANILSFSSVVKNNVEFMSPMYFINQFLESYKGRDIIIDEETINKEGFSISHIMSQRLSRESLDCMGEEEYDNFVELVVGFEYANLGRDRWFEKLNDIVNLIEYRPMDKSEKQIFEEMQNAV